ncbi:MAG: glycosyltransferase family 2 protein, partial [Candidatus Falkowbacteria bacterium]|nr:glycosyltransferase family 2 protein [Candidatus Falkowbacteria bacterium]
SIITPAYNEKDNIEPLYEALKAVFATLENHDFELIFVNDGSKDGTSLEIRKLSEKDERVKYLEFSRNFGKETATTCGINHSSGDACILIDADLQHPVELIPEFIKKWEKGFEVVIGVRRRNKSASLLKRMGSCIFYKINKSISDVGNTKVPAGSTDFRLMDRVVIDEFNRFTEKNRMTRGLIDWLGFRRGFISFEAK